MQSSAPPALIAGSAAMDRVVRLARTYAPIPRSVTLVGPTGVGKGLLASWIHHWSGRPGGFVAMTGGQLTDELLGSQLFGHVRGAFTDAKQRVRGAFEQADRGTLFLDELPHWSRTMQSGLLRALGDGAFRPIGAERDLPVTCRILFGSIRPLEDLVADCLLLSDLRWRAGVFEIRIPPLVTRPKDMLTLAIHFLEQAQRLFGLGHIDGFSPQALRRLLDHSWPGNVRELVQVVEFGLVHASSAASEWIESDHLPAHVAAGEKPRRLFDRETQRELIEWALAHAEGRRSEAAELLGVHRNTLRRRMRRTSGGHPQAG